MATLKDIAAEANVSVDTVSRVLRGTVKGNYPRVAKRADRIRHIARKLGYRPNVSARSMRLGRFGNIALLLSTERRRSTLPPALLDGVHDALAERDMNLTLAKLPDSALTERYVPKILREWCADGLLVNYHKDIPPGMPELIDRFGHPAIWLNCKRDADCVRPDDFDAGRRLTAHLIAQGHRRITYVDFHCGFRRDADDHYSNYDRWEGYRAAMQEAGLETRRIDTGDSPHRNRDTREFWENAATCCLAQPDRPTAVVGYGPIDVTAMLLAARTLGLRVPEDLALASFAPGQMIVAGLRVPTMRVPDEAVGRAAVEMVLEKIERPREHLSPRLVPFTLETRQ